MVVATITDGAVTGRGECVPYGRYLRERRERGRRHREACGPPSSTHPDRGRLQNLLPAGAARNALDCALWDLEAKRSGVPVVAQR